MFPSQNALNNRDRLAALSRLNLLDTPAEPAFDRLTNLAAQILGVPVCLVSLVDDRRQFFKSAEGLGGAAGAARQTPLTHSFCQHVVTSGLPLVVDDAPKNSLVCDNGAVADLGVIAYLGMPIRSPEQLVLGSFCVIDIKPRNWQAHEMDLVRKFADLVESEIAARARSIQNSINDAQQRALLEGTLFCVIATSAEGVIEQYNTGAENMLGFTAAELVGQSLLALHLEEEVAARAVELGVVMGRKFAAGFEAVVAHTQLQKSENRDWTYVRKDGRRRAVLLDITALRDSSGEISGFLCVVQDVTERKQIEADRHEALTRLAKLEAHVPGMIYQFRLRPDGSACFPYASEGIRGIYRVTPEEVREDAGKVFERLHPEDLAEVSESIAESARELKTWHQEYRVRYADGVERWLLGNATPEREADGSVLWHGFITDISKRRQADDELRFNVERLQLAADAAGVAVWEWDVVTGKILWDPGMFAMYGVDPTPSRQVPFETWAGGVHPEDLAAQVAQLNALVKSGGRNQREFRIVRGAGAEVRYIHAAEMLIKDRQGNPMRVVGVNIDITERKQAESALESTRARLEKIFAAMSEGLVMQDATGAILECNVAAERILGLSRQQIAGRSSLDPEWRTLHEDGSAFPGEEHPAMVTLRTGVAQRDVVMGVRQPDGALGWIEINTELIGAATDPGRQVVCSFREVTARRAAEQAMRASEERFRSFALVAPVGIYQTDPEGRCVYVNARWSKIAGLSEQEAMGEGWFAAVHEADRSAIGAAWSAFLREESEFVLEYRFVRRSGEVVWVSGAAVPLRNDQGRLTGYLGTVTDISLIKEGELARQRLAESLEQARDQALESSRLKSEFLANMSHEIRTPMNAIIGMSTLLRDSPLNPQQLEMGTVIGESAENLLNIINDILDFSKIEAGKLRIEVAEFSLRAVFEETLALLSGRAHEQGLELLCDFDARLELPLLGDAGRFRQMLINLVGNAIKFTSVGEVLVAAELVAAESDGVRFRVRVRDTGIGIAEGVQARLFQPFYQADGTATRNYGGTGLGLAITRQLVELMGGQIGLQSEPGKGSEFWFEVALKASPRGAVTALAPLPAGVRVLLVDDNANSLRILAAQLQAQGAQVDVAPSGALALEKLQAALSAQQPYAVIVLDTHMTEMGGVELARRIRALPALEAVPLVMLSSSGPGVQPVGELQQSTTLYLSKPVRSEQLQRALRQALGLESAVPKPVASPTQAFARKGLSLLVVEDNPINQLLMHKILDKIGCQMQFANNGAEALDMVAANSYSVVLMDCQMPVMDGYSATRKIREREAAGNGGRVPIIALTAYAMPEDRAKCLEAGMDDYLSKPLREADLCAALERCCKQPGAVAPQAAAPEPREGVLLVAQIDQLREIEGYKFPTLLEDIGRLFLAETPPALVELRGLLEQRKAGDTARKAHAIAGSSAALGGARLRMTALALEKAAAKEDWAAAAELLVALEADWQLMLAALKEIDVLR